MRTVPALLVCRADAPLTTFRPRVAGDLGLAGSIMLMSRCGAAGLAALHPLTAPDGQAAWIDG